MKTLDSRWQWIVDQVKDDPGAPLEIGAIELAANLSPADYQRYRRDLGNAGFKGLATLDNEIRIAKEPNENSNCGEFPDTDPWPEPVDSEEVVSQGMGLFSQFMMMEEDHKLLAVMWSLHTHAYKEFDHTPRLLITAPDYGCAKSQLLKDIIGPMSNRPWWCENITAPTLFRQVHKHAPTCLVDEVDTFINRESAEIMGVINGGWDSKGVVPRCVGNDYEVQNFHTHSPLAMSGINLGEKLKESTLSRSIKIILEKATQEEIRSNITKFSRKKHEQLFVELRRKFARWMSDNKHRIDTTEIDMPDVLEGRHEDAYTPLLIIAKMVSDKCYEECGAALYNQYDIAPPNTSKQLLAAIMEETHPNEEKIYTTELINRICSEPENRWINYNTKNSDPERRKIQSWQVASLLSGYKDCKPQTVNIGGGRLKGYYVAPLRNAWQRYAKGVTPLLSKAGADSNDNQPVTSEQKVTPSKQLIPNECVDSNGVTASEPVSGGIEKEPLDINPYLDEDDPWDDSQERIQETI